MTLPTILLAAAAAAAPVIPAESGPETIKLLKELIAIDTSYPPGDELKAVRHVEPLLREAGIETRVFEPSPGRGNLWARIKGDGSGKPMLFLAHIDVVPAKRADWESDPFKAEQRGDHLYGRGTIDDKGMAAAAVTAMRLLARGKVPLKRDVILFLGADEETGGKLGMEWMLDNHPDLVAAEVVLNEGGTIDIEDGKITQARVQSYEKLYLDVTLTAEGPSGHSSVPSADNAVVRLAQAVAKVGGHRFAPSLNPVTRAYFQGMARLAGHPLHEEFAALASASAGPAHAAAIEKLSAAPQYNAMLRTTCTPTVIEAGFKNSAIPGKAKANVNCRILPTEKPEEVVEALKRAIEDPKVAVTTSEEADKPALSRPDHPFVAAIGRVMKAMAPEAVTVPYMSNGATDSRKLRYRGIDAYGLMPLPVTVDDKVRMHGNNERVRIDSVPFGVEFLYRLALEYAG